MHGAPLLRVIDLGRLPYGPAYDIQVAHCEEVFAARQAGHPEPGRLLLVEHEPVITISNRPAAADHLLADAETLERHGVAVVRTDRGGDITYHGPGQLVAYPILDLNLLNLGLHSYVRLLERVIIDTCDAFGVHARRDPPATGVWADPAAPNGGAGVGADAGPAKIGAIGVRVRRWVSMHGLALNVTTNLEHFGLIVPCGLAGRSVTTLARECAAVGVPCPSMEVVKERLAGVFQASIGDVLAAAAERRAAASLPEGEAGGGLFCRAAPAQA